MMQKKRKLFVHDEDKHTLKKQKPTTIESFSETKNRIETIINYLKNGDTENTTQSNDSEEEEKEEKESQENKPLKQYHSDPHINWAINEHKRNGYRDDSEFCVQCLKFLFTDMPDEANFALCQTCMHYQCLPCAVSTPNQVLVSHFDKLKKKKTKFVFVAGIQH